MKQDICSGKHAGNANSFLANLRVHAAKPSQRERIYLSLANDSRATCEELSVRLGIRYTACSARISELKAMRWVTYSGETRQTSGGADAAVLRAIGQAEREELLRPRTAYTGRQRELFSA